MRIATVKMVLLRKRISNVLTYCLIALVHLVNIQVKIRPML